MQGGYREDVSLAGVWRRDSSRRLSGKRASTAALGSVMAILAAAALAFAPDYIRLISANYSATNSSNRGLCGHPYKLAKPVAPQRVFYDPGSKGIRALAFCPNGSFLAAADGNGHVFVWSMATHKIVTVLHDTASRGVNAVAYRPRSGILATGDANGSVYLWQPGIPRPRRLRDPASKGVRALAFSPGGALLAVADGNGRTYVWAMARHRIVLTLRVARSRGVNAVTFGTGGKVIATGNANGWAYEWAISGKRRARLQVQHLDPGSKGVKAVAFRPKTETLATADANGRAYLWPAGATQPSTLADAKPAAMAAESFTPNGDFLATADADGHLLLWDAESDEIVELLPPHGAPPLRAVALSRDGRRVAAGDINGAIYISDVTRIGIDVVLKAADSRR